MRLVAWHTGRTGGGARSMRRVASRRRRRRRPRGTGVEAGKDAAGSAGRDGDRLLDRHADHAAPLGPRPVVVPDAAEAEQLMQDEPRMARPFADPAVRDDVLVAGDALARIQRLELLASLERPVLAHGLRPRDRRRTRDVARALCGLAHARRGDDLAVELGG